MGEVLDRYYKAVRLDGTSHYDGKTLWTPGEVLEVPGAECDGLSCGRGIHGSPTLLQAVGYQLGPSLYLTFAPDGECLGRDESKARFRRVVVGEYLTQAEVDAIAGFGLWEANHPYHPLKMGGEGLGEGELVRLLSQWDSVGDSVGDSVRASVWDSVGASVGGSVWDSVRASVGGSVWASVGGSVWASVGGSVWVSVRVSVGDPVWASVGASVRGYIGGLFPGITIWKYAESLGPDPWRPLLTLWYAGYVPSFDGATWRLHRGEKAEVVSSISQKELRRRGG